MTNVKFAERKFFRPGGAVPIYPPGNMGRIQLVFSNGPGIHEIEHSHYAPQIEDVFRLAPKFVVLLRAQARGENNVWHKTVGTHCKVFLPLAILSSRRILDTTYDLVGQPVLPNMGATVGDPRRRVEIRQYDIANRRCNAFLSRETYMLILDAWMDGNVETAAGY